MTIRLRIHRHLCELMRTDLVRRHPFAAERVGFARAAIGIVGDGALVLLKSYWPVPDEQYVNDRYVGARINGTAIRNAMQEVLSGNNGHGLFHVHMHPFPGPTGMSRTDAKEIPKLVECFRNVGVKAAHGLLILTPNHAYSLVLLPGADQLVKVDKITIVGYPTEILR